MYLINRPRIRGKYRLTEADIRTVVGLILLRGEEIRPTERINACRDPKDNKFLEVAVAGQAEVLVSGDEDLLVLHPFRGIPIVSPAEFLELLDEAEAAEMGGA
jgi:predicted nucleic acid-binding protein